MSKEGLKWLGKNAKLVPGQGSHLIQGNFWKSNHWFLSKIRKELGNISIRHPDTMGPFVIYAEHIL